MGDLLQRMHELKEEFGLGVAKPTLKTPLVYYRLSDTTDPEERLEDACMWKALHDEYGDDIQLIGNETDTRGLSFFGRPLNREFHLYDRFRYWEDEAFLARANRSFAICDLAEAREEVERLHSGGHGAFVKAMKDKFMTLPIPLGTTFSEAMNGMEFSFCDEGRCLLVQPLVSMEFEHRFFVINREIVTDSPVQWRLTPLDTSRYHGWVARTPRSEPECMPDIYVEFCSFAKESARVLAADSYSLDIAVIDGRPGIVELNPMRIGRIGLYAANVRSLAYASRSLLPAPLVETGG